LFFSVFAYSQTRGASAVKKDRKQADEAYDKSDFAKSYGIYMKLAKQDTANMELWFRVGSSLFNMNKMDTSSIKYFEKSKAKIPESHFYLGKYYQLTGHSKHALEEFYQFKSVNTEETIENTEVNHWIKVSESAIVEEAKKGNYIIKNLGAGVNSSYPEYVPLIWSVNGSLIFTSRRSDSKGGLKDPYGRFYEDIYMAQKGVSGWNKPQSLSDDLNTTNHDACVALSPSGSELIIYRTDEKQTGGDFYLTTYDGNKWGAPVKMGPEINSEYLEASACFSNDGNEIVFSSNRPGGLGGKDLYRIRKFMNGKYSLPYNLGPNVNTAEDDDAPFIDKDNILYFSSKGHNSIGEYDIFKADFNESTLNWGQAQNLGIPINSTNDDIYFTKLDDSQTAMFTSRREGGMGDADIYEINFSESTQLIAYCKFNTQIDKNELKDLQLSIYDMESGRLEGKYKANKNYLSMVVVTQKDKMYKVIIEGANIEPIVKNMVFTDKDKELNFELLRRIK
jgi:hypothetical protein